MSGAGTAISPQDRAAVADLLAGYARAVDAGDYDALDALFTDDAELDFRTFAGPVGSLAEIKAFLGSALAGFAATQHMMGLPAMTARDGGIDVRTPCHNPMVFADGAVWLIGLVYHDRCRPSEHGWRFASRRQERVYTVTGLRDTPFGGPA